MQSSILLQYKPGVCFDAVSDTEYQFASKLNIVILELLKVGIYESLVSHFTVGKTDR